MARVSRGVTARARHKKVIKKAKEVKYSERGELEITSLNQIFLKENKLNVKIMNRGATWLDTGTFDSLSEASTYIQTLEHRQGLKIGSPEEISWRNGWITSKQLGVLASRCLKSGYGKYLNDLITDKDIDNK